MKTPSFLPVVQQEVERELHTLAVATQGVVSQLGHADLLGTNTRQLLDRLARSHACAIDASFVDASGIMRIVAPKEYGKFKGANICQQPQIRRLHKTQESVLSDCFRSVEGIEAVDLECPVISAEKKTLGSVSLLFRPEVLLRGIAERSNLPRGWKLLVLEMTGRCLYSHRKADIGKNLLGDPQYRSFVPLRSLARNVVRHAGGSGTYDLAEAGEPAVICSVFWTTVTLYGTAWRLMVVCGPGSGGP
jgi:hypothetical protein